MIHQYLTSHHPPMLALQVQLGYPGGALRSNSLLAIVDTGADGSLVPQSLLDEIGAPLIDQVRARSHWGEWRTMQLFTVDIGLGGVRLPAAEVAGDAYRTEVILGRNVINQLKLLLDGPASQITIVDL